jgi:hypothetical protein
VSEAFTARWERGSTALAVSCPHGRAWAYPVVPVGDKPLPHFLWDTPWMVCPGGGWSSDDDITWTAAVVPVSSAAAAELFAPDSALLPPGQPTVARAGTYPG